MGVVQRTVEGIGDGGHGGRKCAGGGAGSD